MKKLTNIVSLVLIVPLLVSSIGIPLTTHAAISEWKKSVSIEPFTTTDFSTETTKQSIRDAKSAGANYITFIIPYYQANRQSTEMRPGWNTPTDASLITAINYAHSIGLKVMLKPHLETDYIEWRGNIDPAPADRPAWFASYTAMLLKYGRIGQRYGVEDYCIGTELLRMANPTYNSTNTENWKNMIANVRKVYSGKMTYSANWYGELDTIEFWPQLDYIGISAYYDLYHAENSSPEELKKSWDGWRTGVIEPIEKKFNMPVVFTELGYRSIDGAYRNPWDWSRDGTYNETDQANSYEALFSYWNNVPWMKGVSLWRWDVNPTAGGQGDIDYTPQNKLATQIMKQYWANGTVPPQTPVEKPAFIASATLVPVTPIVNQNSTLSVKVTNSGGATSGTIVDVEIYNNSTNQRFTQKYFDNQTFAKGDSRSFEVPFTPNAAGNYHVEVGTFTSNWQQNYYWGSNVKTFTVGSDQTTTPPGGGTGTTTPSTVNQNPTVSVWWPSAESHINGVQPFKAALSDRSLRNYTMSWQVDGDRLNPMTDSTVDAPHKESLVDVSGWTWKGSGTYTINFVAEDKITGKKIEKSVDVYIN